MKDWEGDEHEWVVSSAATVLGRPEVYLFPATEKGEITDWSELSGSLRDTLEHDEPLMALGYEVVKS
jgi:hypothetical protein